MIINSIFIIIYKENIFNHQYSATLIILIENAGMKSSE